MRVGEKRNCSHVDGAITVNEPTGISRDRLSECFSQKDRRNFCCHEIIDCMDAENELREKLQYSNRGGNRCTNNKKTYGSAFFLLFLFVMPDNPVAGRFESSFNINEGSNQGRIYNWKEALPIIVAHPLGVGIGMYPLYVDPLATYRMPIYAHDLYLDIAAELGIIAAIVFIAFLVVVFARFWQAAKTDPFWSAGVASLTVFSVHSLVETPLYSVHVLTLFLIVASLAITKTK